MALPREGRKTLDNEAAVRTVGPLSKRWRENVEGPNEAQQRVHDQAAEEARRDHDHQLGDDTATAHGRIGVGTAAPPDSEANDQNSDNSEKRGRDWAFYDSVVQQMDEEHAAYMAALDAQIEAIKAEMRDLRKSILYKQGLREEIADYIVLVDNAWQQYQLTGEVTDPVVRGLLQKNDPDIDFDNPQDVTNGFSDVQSDLADQDKALESQIRQEQKAYDTRKEQLEEFEAHEASILQTVAMGGTDKDIQDLIENAHAGGSKLAKIQTEIEDHVNARPNLGPAVQEEFSAASTSPNVELEVANKELNNSLNAILNS